MKSPAAFWTGLAMGALLALMVLGRYSVVPTPGGNWEAVRINRLTGRGAYLNSAGFWMNTREHSEWVKTPEYKAAYDEFVKRPIGGAK